MSASTDKPIGVGVAGLGRSGWDIHVAALGKLTDQYRLVAACDPIIGRQAQARDTRNCRAYARFEDMLADDNVELVMVATPNHLHAPMSIAALKAGKHVFVEKPFATNLHDAEQMLATAQETGRVLTCHQNSRYNPSFLKVREVIASGKLGRIVQIRIASHGFGRRWDWQTFKEFGGGTLNNNGSHLVDQALLLLGEAEPEVFCHLERTPLSSGDADDHVKVTLKAPGAPIIDVELTSVCPYAQDVWLIMGTLGGLTGTHAQLRWKYVDPASLRPRPANPDPTPDRSYNRENLDWTEETCTLANENYPHPTQRLYRELYATLREGAPPPVSPESLRRQSIVLQKCRDLSPV
jgi:predicted dehydrogenase